MTLRFLATGDNLHTLAYAFCVGHSTVAEIVVEMSVAIFQVLQAEYMSPPSTEQWKQIAGDFYKSWNFPNCVGAIDGKHIAIQAPSNCGSDFINYKGFHSLILLGVCDASYSFTLFDLGAYGREGDAKVYDTSSISEALSQGALGIPPCTRLPSSDHVVPHMLVGDGAFPLKSYLMRPFPGRKNKNLTSSQNIFNYR